MQSIAWEALIGGLFAAVFLVVALAPVPARWRHRPAPAPLEALPTPRRVRLRRRPALGRPQRPAQRVSVSLRRRDAHSNR